MDGEDRPTADSTTAEQAPRNFLFQRDYSISVDLQII
jgi:hypothetical protein